MKRIRLYLKLVKTMLLTGWACISVSAKGRSLAELKHVPTLSFAMLAEQSNVEVREPVFQHQKPKPKSKDIELGLNDSCERSFHQLQGSILTLGEMFSGDCDEVQEKLDGTVEAFAVLQSPLETGENWISGVKNVAIPTHQLAEQTPEVSAPVVDMSDDLVEEGISGVQADEFQSISELEDLTSASEILETQKTLTVALVDEKISIEPSVLKIKSKDSVIDFVFEGLDQNEVRLFLRNQNSANLEGSSLVIKEFGQNEIYIVWEDQMKIVPVEIAEPADALVDALVLNANQVTVAGSVTDLASLDQDFSIGEIENQSLAMVDQGENTISIAASREQSIKSIQRRQVESSGFSLTQDVTNFSGRFAIQVVDDRSSPDSLYPVVGAKVAIAGSDIIAETDATGHFYLSDLPKGSSLALTIEDPNGYLYPTKAVVAVPETNQVAQVMAARFDHISLMAQAASTVPDVEKGILCVSLSGSESVSGMGLQIDAQDQKVFYYNDYGFIDPAQGAFASNGRACFFNLQPDLYHLTVENDDVEQASIPVQISAGRFTDIPLNLNSEAEKVFRLAAVGTVTEQLSNSSRLANRLRTVPDAELIGYGGIEFERLSDGVLKSVQGLFYQGGSAFVFQDDANFEPTLYRVDNQKSESVLPLFPMGFVEDLAAFADLSVEAGFAHLVANFHKDSSLRGTVIQYEIFDHRGDRLNIQPFFYGETPSSKAIYFNLEPGIYHLVMKDDLGNWLASDQLVMYSDIVSYFEAGAKYSYAAPTTQ